MFYSLLHFSSSPVNTSVPLQTRKLQRRSLTFLGLNTNCMKSWPRTILRWYESFDVTWRMPGLPSPSVNRDKGNARICWLLSPLTKEWWEILMIYDLFTFPLQVWRTVYLSRITISYSFCFNLYISKFSRYRLIEVTWEHVGLIFINVKQIRGNFYLCHQYSEFSFCR